MANNKQNLEKLLKFIKEISDESGNEWFKSELKKHFSGSIDLKNKSIDEIYEYCIKAIIKENAQEFYKDFKLTDIKQKLILDFIRMEQFRREGNFEDFCLSVFQQLEAIVNRLISNEVQLFIIENKDLESHKIKDKDTRQVVPQKLWQLIFYHNLNQEELNKKLSKKIFEWDFSERYKAVLFYFYFDKKIYDYFDFLSIFYMGNDLYQARNLNHRGGQISLGQQTIVDKVQSQKHKYYFKFLGFLEDFTSKINNML